MIKWINYELLFLTVMIIIKSWCIWVMFEILLVGENPSAVYTWKKKFRVFLLTASVEYEKPLGSNLWYGVMDQILGRLEFGSWHISIWSRAPYSTFWSFYCLDGIMEAIFLMDSYLNLLEGKSFPTCVLFYIYWFRCLVGFLKLFLHYIFLLQN